MLIGPNKHVWLFLRPNKHDGYLIILIDVIGCLPALINRIYLLLIISTTQVTDAESKVFANAATDSEDESYALF